jgi:deferrochelatase/peroxidase EfeB
MTVAGALQEGIYHAPGVSPGKFFAILFLRAGEGLGARQAGEVFSVLWETYQDLKSGNVGDLPGHPVPSGNLTVLVGYGPNAFQLGGARRPLPDDLGSRNQFRSPRPTGGGPLLVGSGLWYAEDVRANLATEEIAVQFIAETQLAVNRAVLETWKVLHDAADHDTGAAPLLLTSFFTGFQRDDGRSWIDFHDGISNLKSQDRYGVLAIKPRPVPEDGWIEGGTYLAFLRLGVDLSAWRNLDRRQQELIVGRDKLSGCPLEGIDDAGNPVAQNGCPVSGTSEIDISGGPNDSFREPPDTAVPVLRQSHVQRANHHVRPASDRNSLRVYRQGYEFLEPLGMAPGFRAGLNFVSFQDTPERLLRVLTQDGWLGGTNFGGDPDNPLPGMDRLLSVRAGGVFLVPPVTDEERFPGSSIFL